MEASITASVLDALRTAMMAAEKAEGARQTQREQRAWGYLTASALSALSALGAMGFNIAGLPSEADILGAEGAAWSEHITKTLSAGPNSARIIISLPRREV